MKKKIFDSKNIKLVSGQYFNEEEFQTYLKNITSVTVNGKEYDWEVWIDS